MTKIFIFLVCMSLALFDFSQSAYFQCEYATRWWDSTVNSPYTCEVRNSVSITSLDAAIVEDVTGDHKAGYKNDNVEAFSVIRCQMYYFPRRLNKFFKNLKGIKISITGLKEIHQNDLKEFPQLKSLDLQSNQLEVLEENLFEFNPNLECIQLATNKISYIHPNVFDKLTKLNSLFFSFNTCIDMYAMYPTALQNFIKTSKAQCTNSEYPNLEQKVKNLEIESDNLKSESFKEKFQNLENEIKNSKFPNTFYRRLKDLKAAQVKMAQEEVPETLKEINEKLSTLKEETLKLGNESSQCIKKMTGIEKKLTYIAPGNNDNLATISGAVLRAMEIIENLSKKMEAFEEKLAGMDNIEENLMNKIDEKFKAAEEEQRLNQMEIIKKLKAILKAV